jgi:hypothetical protein
LACVSLRWSDIGACRDSDCLQAIATVLRVNGVATLSTQGGLASKYGQPGCVGIRADIGGTTQEAECLVELLGPGYVVDATGCRVDGFPHMVIVR